VRRNVRRQVTIEDDDYSLEELGRAIVYAPRSDGVTIWRAFVRTKRGEVMRQTATLRIRRRTAARVSPHSQPTMPLAIFTPPTA
jgi:hypothetical protein